MNPSLLEVHERHGLTDADLALVRTYVPLYRKCNLVLAPDGNPYLYRWHIRPRNKTANIYFHIQVASDPERPLHDHPWDNTSVILAGGYEEHIAYVRDIGVEVVRRTVGDVVNREAEDAHRLVLPEGVPYTMTLFTTGPHKREWGFWYPHGWVHNKDVVRTENGISIHEELKL